MTRDRLLVERVAALEQGFRRIARERMQGLPVVNPALQVQAVGFAPEVAGPDVALGVLITPWFMNLLRLPLDEVGTARLPVPGGKALLTLGEQQLEFIGAEEPQIGRYALCSLFSPMAGFADQAVARATAAEVLRLLLSRGVAHQAQAAEPAPTASLPATPAAGPARRGFLFGRSANGSGAAR